MYNANIYLMSSYNFSWSEQARRLAPTPSKRCPRQGTHLCLNKSDSLFTQFHSLMMVIRLYFFKYCNYIHSIKNN